MTVAAGVNARLTSRLPLLPLLALLLTKEVHGTTVSPAAAAINISENNQRKYIPGEHSRSADSTGLFSPWIKIPTGVPEYYGASGLPHSKTSSTLLRHSREGGILFTILRAAVLLRDNLVTVFGFFLHQPNNALGEDLYSSLSILHELVRLRRLQTARLVSLLPAMSESALSTQFLILFRRLLYFVPRYARAAVEVWIEELQKDRVNVDSVMKTHDGTLVIDFLAGFDRATIDELNADAILKADQSNEFAYRFVSAHDILSEVLQGLQDKSIKLTQPLFALIVSYRSRNIIQADKEESERYLIQVLSRSEIEEWERVISMVKPEDYENPHALIRSILQYLLLELPLLNQLTRFAVKEVLEYSEDPKPTFMNEHFETLTSVMNTPIMDVFKLLEVIVPGQYPDDIVDLKHKVEYYIRNGLLSIETAINGFSRFDHVNPANLLIGVLSRIQKMLPYLPHEIMSAVNNLKIYINRKLQVINLHKLLNSDVENMLVAYDSYGVPNDIVTLSRKLQVQFPVENIDWKKITNKIDAAVCGDPRSCVSSILQEALKSKMFDNLPSQVLVSQLLSHLDTGGNPSGLGNKHGTLCYCGKEEDKTRRKTYAGKKKRRGSVCANSNCETVNRPKQQRPTGTKKEHDDEYLSQYSPLHFGANGKTIIDGDTYDLIASENDERSSLVKPSKRGRIENLLKPRGKVEKTEKVPKISQHVNKNYIKSSHLWENDNINVSTTPKSSLSTKKMPKRTERRSKKMKSKNSKYKNSNAEQSDNAYNKKVYLQGISYRSKRELSDSAEYKDVKHSSTTREEPKETIDSYSSTLYAKRSTSQIKYSTRPSSPSTTRRKRSSQASGYRYSSRVSTTPISSITSKLTSTTPHVKFSSRITRDDHPYTTTSYQSKTSYQDTASPQTKTSHQSISSLQSSTPYHKETSHQSSTTYPTTTSPQTKTSHRSSSSIQSSTPYHKETSHQSSTTYPTTTSPQTKTSHRSSSSIQSSAPYQKETSHQSSTTYPTTTSPQTKTSHRSSSSIQSSTPYHKETSHQSSTTYQTTTSSQTKTSHRSSSSLQSSTPYHKETSHQSRTVYQTTTSPQTKTSHQSSASPKGSTPYHKETSHQSRTIYQTTTSPQTKTSHQSSSSPKGSTPYHKETSHQSSTTSHKTSSTETKTPYQSSSSPQSSFTVYSKDLSHQSSTQSVTELYPTMSVTERNVNVTKFDIPSTETNTAFPKITISPPEEILTSPLVNATVPEPSDTISQTQSTKVHYDVMIQGTNVTISITSHNDTNGTFISNFTSTTAYPTLLPAGNNTIVPVTLNDTYEEFTEAPVIDRNITVETKGRYKIITNEWSEKIKTHKRHHIHGIRLKGHAPPPHPTHTSHTTHSHYSGKTDSHDTSYGDHMSSHNDHEDTTSKPKVIYESPIQYIAGHRPVRYRIVKFKRLKHSKGKRLRRHKIRKVPRYRHYPQIKPNRYYSPIDYPPTNPNRYHSPGRPVRYPPNPHQSRWPARRMETKYQPTASAAKTSKNFRPEKESHNNMNYSGPVSKTSTRRQQKYSLDSHEENYEDIHRRNKNYHGDHYESEEEYDDSYEPEHVYDSHEHNPDPYYDYRSEEDMSLANERYYDFEDDYKDNPTDRESLSYQSESHEYDDASHRDTGRNKGRHMKEYVIEPCDTSSEECDYIDSREDLLSHREYETPSSEEDSYENGGILFRSSSNDSKDENNFRKRNKIMKFPQHRQRSRLHLSHTRSQNSYQKQREGNSYYTRDKYEKIASKNSQEKGKKYLRRRQKFVPSHRPISEEDSEDYDSSEEYDSQVDSHSDREERIPHNERNKIEKMNIRLKNLFKEIEPSKRGKGEDRKQSIHSTLNKAEKNTHYLEHEYQDLLNELSSSEEALLFEDEDVYDLDEHHNIRDDTEDTHDHHDEFDYDEDALDRHHKDYDDYEEEGDYDREYGYEDIDEDCSSNDCDSLHGNDYIIGESCDYSSDAECDTDNYKERHAIHSGENDPNYSEYSEEDYNDDLEYNAYSHLRRQLAERESSAVKQMKSRVSTGWKPQHYTLCYDKIFRTHVVCLRKNSFPELIYEGPSQHLWKGKWTYPLDLFRAYLFTNEESVSKLLYKAKNLKLRNSSKPLSINNALSAEILLQALSLHYLKMGERDETKPSSSKTKEKHKKPARKTVYDKSPNNIVAARKQRSRKMSNMRGIKISNMKSMSHENKNDHAHQYGLFENRIMNFSDFNLKIIRKALSPLGLSRLPIPDETTENLPANTLHPDTLLPFTVPGTLPDIKMRPLRIFLGLPNIYAILGDYSPPRLALRGPLLRELLRRILRSKSSAARDPLLRRAASDLLRSWEERRKLKTRMLRVDTDAIQDALPVIKESEEDDTVDKVYRFLFIERPAPVAETLAAIESDVKMTKGQLLKKVLQLLVNLEDLQNRTQLIEDLKEVSHRVLLDGLGAQSVPLLPPPASFLASARAMQGQNMDLGRPASETLAAAGPRTKNHEHSASHRTKTDSKSLKGEFLAATKMQLGTARVANVDDVESLLHMER